LKLELISKRNIEIDDRLAEEDTLRTAKNKKMTEVYAGMKADKSAKILSKMDVNIAARILATMDNKKSGKILSEMDVDAAQKISIILLGI